MSENVTKAQQLMNYYAQEIIAYGANIARLRNLENAWENLKIQSEIVPNVGTRADAQVAPQWQPIETAPKIGKLFDVWCVDPKCSAIGVRFTDVAMRGDQSGLGYLTNTGEWEYLEEDGVYPPWQPTHWMPLPEPPK